MLTQTGPNDLTSGLRAGAKPIHLSEDLQDRTGPSSGNSSVIADDLKIVGHGLKISSLGVLQVNGEIEGDVRAAEVIVGERGQVTGLVAGQSVIIRGTVWGVICARTVALQASSKVEGDIHHMSFSLEKGAMFDGRSRRAGSEVDLEAVMDATCVP